VDLGAALTCLDAVTDADNLDALELEPLVEPEGLASVPGQARKVLHEDDVKWGRGAQGRREELLVALTGLAGKP